MFEDIINTPKKEKEKGLYVCNIAKDCDHELCLHRWPHDCNLLGRPEQPEDEDACDCSKVKCQYGGICIPA